jgi:hypothetical protein
MENNLEKANRLLKKIYLEIADKGKISLSTTLKITEYVNKPLNYGDHKFVTEPEGCPICDTAFFTGSCNKCGYIDPNRDNEHQ